MILYRPLGLEELRLVYELGLRAFPARLPEQPIFYPVLSLPYARKIASEWNATSDSYAGYVVRFSIDDAYGSNFPIRTAGGSEHQELWVPSGQLEEFNRHIQGVICLVEAHFGDRFRGLVPTGFGLKGKDATEQLVALRGMYEYSLMDFHGEVTANNAAVFLHFPFWSQRDFSRAGVADEERKRLLQAVEGVWKRAYPERPLGLTA